MCALLKGPGENCGRNIFIIVRRRMSFEIPGDTIELIGAAKRGRSRARARPKRRSPALISGRINFICSRLFAGVHVPFIAWTRRMRASNLYIFRYCSLNNISRFRISYPFNSFDGRREPDDGDSTKATRDEGKVSVEVIFTRQLARKRKKAPKMNREDREDREDPCGAALEWSNGTFNHRAFSRDGQRNFAAFRSLSRYVDHEFKGT